MSSLLRRVLVNSLKFSSIKFLQLRGLQYIPIEPKNKIVIGHKMTQLIERKSVIHAKKQLDKQKYEIDKSKANCIISCNKKQFNHYYGQIYPPNFSERFYASIGWRKRQTNGDYFTINAFGPHPAINKEDSIKSLAELNIDENLINSLKTKFNIKKPTKIQELTLEKIRDHAMHHLIAAETGCGKTLSYVIPLIEEVIRFKKEINVKRSANEPICLVIVPTRELAFQAYEVFKKFINDDLSFRLVLDLKQKFIIPLEIDINQNIDSKLEHTDNIPPDIVITIPSQLKENFYKSNNYILPIHLRKLVIDEANLLLDDSNNQSILRIINYLNLNLKSIEENFKLNRLNNTQLLFVSATIPRDMKNILESIIDVSTELEVISTSNINKIMLHVPQHFFRLSADGKKEKLLEIIRRSENDSIMIFSNKANTAIFIYKFLQENDINACLFHSAMSDYERHKSIQQFLNGECNIISCTDIASRGLDTLDVKHVINFEMPTFIADYVHRIGRVGRVGSTVKGAKVTNLISKAFEIDTVWNIEHSIRTGTDLHNLNANITRILQNRYQPKTNNNVENDEIVDEKTE